MLDGTKLRWVQREETPFSSQNEWSFNIDREKVFKICLNAIFAIKFIILFDVDDDGAGCGVDNDDDGVGTDEGGLGGDLPGREEEEEEEKKC